MYGTTADGQRWFLRSPDEKVTAYFSTLSPADIPTHAVNVAAGHTVEFNVPFALPPLSLKDAMNGEMRLIVEVGTGADLSICVSPVEAMRLVRHRDDGTHPIELYGPDGSRISFEDVLRWDDFEVEAMPRSNP